MIRTLDIVCSECGAAFVPGDKLYYRDNYMNTSIRDTKFICPDCMDCTPIDETGTVVVGEDIPVEAQQKLYVIYDAWDKERKAHVLKDCIFTDEFMRTAVTCETYAGEKFENVAFRVTIRGELQTEIPMPDYMKKQVLEAYKLYEAQNMDDFKEE